MFWLNTHVQLLLLRKGSELKLEYLLNKITAIYQIYAFISFASMNKLCSIFKLSVTITAKRF